MIMGNTTLRPSLAAEQLQLAGVPFTSLKLAAVDFHTSESLRSRNDTTPRAAEFFEVLPTKLQGTSQELS